MEANGVKSLLEELMGNPYVFICGPRRGDTKKPPETKLRVYAHGGVLCELPTTQRAAITLCHENYFKDEPFLRDSFNGLQSKEAAEKFLRDYRDMLVDIMGKRFTSKDKSPEERSQQTIIARAHTDFSRHDGTVVCDFQFAVPGEYGCEGKKLPIFDLVTFSMDKKTGGGVFTLVEYKCNAKACEGEEGESGLKDHAADMQKCLNDSAASAWGKEELLRRLDYMCRYGLLRNCPDGLDHLRPENVELRAAFLFTPGKGLQSQKDAAALCEKYIPRNIRSEVEFSYCFAKSPESVNLSQKQMKEMSLEKFKGD